MSGSESVKWHFADCRLHSPLLALEHSTVTMPGVAVGTIALGAARHCCLMLPSRLLFATS